MRDTWFAILLISAAFQTSVLFAQAERQYSLYTTENGLPQNNVMDIIQDKNGFLWLATWDGISKYDGYNFHNYKVNPGDSYIMKSNRVEKITEDKYNRIWMQSYDGEIHSFNPVTESFWGFQSDENLRNLNFLPSKIVINKSGKVWLLSEKSGCIAILDSLYHNIIFNNTNQILPGNTVNNVFEDNEGNSWILTNKGLSLYANKGVNKKKLNLPGAMPFYSAIETANEIMFGSANGIVWKYLPGENTFRELRLPVNADVIKIIHTKNHKLVFLTTSNEFVVMDMANGNLQTFKTQNIQNRTSEKILSGIIDKSNGLWIETTQLGIYRFDLNTNKIKHFLIPTEDVFSSMIPAHFILVENSEGKTWVQPKGGGFSEYNPVTGNLEAFDRKINASGLTISNIFHSAFVDRQDNLWFCSRTKGLVKTTFMDNYFETKKIFNSDKGLAENDVREIFEDSEKRIWISTKDKRLTIIDQDLKPFGRLSGDGSIKSDAFFTGAVYSICEDSEKNIWVGTKGEGLFRLRSKGNNSFKVEQFKNEAADVFSLSDNNIYNIFQDIKGNIWIGTYGGGLNLLKYKPDGGLYFINHRNNLKNYPMDIASRVRFITEDIKNKICVGTAGGLIMFSTDFRVPDEIDFRKYTRLRDEKESLSNNDIHYIKVTNKGEMFIAAFGGGLIEAVEFDKDGYPLKFKNYLKKDGLPSDVTLSICEDNDEKLWISTENNITRFDPVYNIFETFTEIKPLISMNVFSEASTCKTSGNKLIFGYSKGILLFDPSNVKQKAYIPNISFTDFLIFNKKVPIKANSPLKANINNLNQLILTHNQNFFTIEFAAMDLESPENILYTYKLEGLDSNWNNVQKQRVAHYTNVPKGEYVFRVKSTNNKGLPLNNERALAITVLPSFWETKFALFLYFIGLTALVGLVIYIMVTIMHLKARVKLEKQLAEMKLQFFTEISHEIRTPLTMITAPVEQLLTDAATPEPIRKQMGIVSQNTARLLRLVNQILDLRRIQFLHLKISEIEIAPFINNICNNFRESIGKKYIKFRFINQSANSFIWADADCVEKIFVNLLSNAFKYTPADKEITVTVKNDEKYVWVEICDQGNGLNKEKQKKLFSRFVSFNEDKSKPSTGIGLSIVKELADKHSARLTVESEENKGSCFSVSFLKGFTHFGKDVEIIAAGTEKTENHLNGIKLPHEGDHEHADDTLKHRSKPAILLIEDDNDLRNFMKNILEVNYSVAEAKDGLEGFEKAQKIIPDFIVSDIMMPELDGIKLLQKIKSNPNTSHIPFILLTAKTTIESKLEGLSYGADDYITKPFSIQYFQARISNLIEQRKKLQEIYHYNLISSSQAEYFPQPYIIVPHDEEMMVKVMKIIEDKISERNFTIDDLVEEIKLSRSVFFKKVKTLTGLSPIDFIRSVKMKRASQLLLSGEFMVKEVANMVGIADTKYFAKCFKETYGVNPTEYKNQQMNGKE
jgi:signal transduction histidine kinase/ligand-binding sensor domain-containing protein/DNA-binding response OmpR family regulator